MPSTRSSRFSFKIQKLDPPQTWNAKWHRIELANDSINIRRNKIHAATEQKLISFVKTSPTYLFSCQAADATTDAFRRRWTAQNFLIRVKKLLRNISNAKEQNFRHTRSLVHYKMNKFLKINTKKRNRENWLHVNPLKRRQKTIKFIIIFRLYSIQDQPG